MMIEGGVEDLTMYLKYAHDTRCVLMYFTIEGDIFYLYHQGHYVYVKTKLFVTKNAALSYVGYTNALRFMSAEKERAKKKYNKIHTIQIKEEHVVVLAEISYVHDLTIPIYKDKLYSPTIEKLRSILQNDATQKLPCIRISKGKLLEVKREFKKNVLGSIIRIMSRSDFMLFERIAKGEIKNSYVIDKGFMRMSGSAFQIFCMDDSVLNFICSLQQIGEYGFVDFYRSERFMQIEFNDPPFRFRYYMPIEEKTLGTIKLL